MSLTPDSVVRTWFEDVWNQGKEITIDRLLASDGIAHGLPTADGSPMRGPDAFKPFYRRFRGAFPDIKIEVVRTITEGEMITAHCRVTGSHQSDALGMAATGKPVEFWGMSICRVQNGQIIEAWNCFDFLTFYQQLGIVPQL
jgi:steroid delta-isomerase-like uncharacterized protein